MDDCMCSDPMCKYIEEILWEAGHQIGLRKEAAKKAVLVCMDGKDAVGENQSAVLNQASYLQTVGFSAFPQKQCQMELASLLEPDHPAQFLLCAAVDVLSAWLEEAALEENYISLINNKFRFSSRTGQKMEAAQAAAAVCSQMNQNITLKMQQLLNVPFSLIDSLSLQTYEGEPLKGDLVITFRDRIQQIGQESLLWVPEDFQGKKDIYLEEKFLRYVVKLMAGCEKNPMLFELKEPWSPEAHQPPRFVGCIGRKKLSTLENLQEDVIRFRIEKPMNWAFYLRGRLFFKSSFQGFQADLQAEGKEQDRAILEKALNDEFPGLPASHFKKLMYSLDLLQEQHHGTAALVIRENSSTWEHIRSLATYQKATAVHFAGNFEKAGAEGNPVADAARMDGAVILNTEGNIRFLMTILDGKSCVEGDLSRGSRYNSVRNFVRLYCTPEDDGKSSLGGTPEQNSEEILGVVFSSDGNMDVLSGKELSCDKRRSP